MKKYDVKFLFKQVGILLVVSVIAGLIVSFCMGFANIVGGAMVFAIFIFVVLGILYMLFCNVITGGIAESTMDTYSEEYGFENYSTFVTEGTGTVGAIIRIDETNGRIAYVSYQNPHEFQLALAKDVTNINSSYLEGPFGGTNYVYFEFYYKNKRVRIPTFTADSIQSMQSEEVLEGISKADAFCDIIRNAQNLAV